MAEQVPGLIVFEGGQRFLPAGMEGRAAGIKFPIPFHLPTVKEIDQELRNRGHSALCSIQIKRPRNQRLEDREERALRRIARRLEPPLRRIFLRAVRLTKSSVRLEELANAILNGSIQRRLATIAQLEQFERRLAGYEGPLRRGFLLGSEQAAGVLEGAGITMNFNLMNSHAAAFAQNYTPRLAAHIVRGAEETIRQIIEDAVTFGDTPQTAARRIRSSIGMTGRDQRTYAKIEAELREKGLSESAIEKKLARVERGLVNRRAGTIARTEIIRAANGGQMGLWHEAVTQGLIDKRTTKKQWLATDDELLEEICRGLDGMTIGLDEEFMFGIQHPPQHVNCRCAMRLIFEGEE